MNDQPANWTWAQEASETLDRAAEFLGYTWNLDEWARTADKADLNLTLRELRDAEAVCRNVHDRLLRAGYPDDPGKPRAQHD